MVDFTHHRSELSEIPARRFLEWIELSPLKFGRWEQRFGKLNEHNALVPRDHQIEDWDRQAIIGFFYTYPLEGYRRLAFMMLDRNLVAVSPRQYTGSHSKLRVGKGKENGLIGSEYVHQVDISA